jgi:hypothetical protein
MGRERGGAWFLEKDLFGVVTPYGLVSGFRNGGAGEDPRGRSEVEWDLVEWDRMTCSGAMPDDVLRGGT